MFEEKDFLMKQIKNIAKGLGKFLGVKEIEDIIFMDENHARELNDRELESIVVVAKLESIHINSEYSLEEFAAELDSTVSRLEELFENEDDASFDEIEKINQFIDLNNQYL